MTFWDDDEDAGFPPLDPAWLEELCPAPAVEDAGLERCFPVARSALEYSSSGQAPSSSRMTCPELVGGPRRHAFVLSGELDELSVPAPDLGILIKGGLAGEELPPAALCSGTGSDCLAGGFEVGPASFITTSSSSSPKSGNEHGDGSRFTGIILAFAFGSFAPLAAAAGGGLAS